MSAGGRTRLAQLVAWAGPDFDGLLVFDESHKAKNLVLVCTSYVCVYVCVCMYVCDEVYFC